MNRTDTLRVVFGELWFWFQQVQVEILLPAHFVRHVELLKRQMSLKPTRM